MVPAPLSSCPIPCQGSNKSLPTPRPILPSSLQHQKSSSAPTILYSSKPQQEFELPCIGTWKCLLALNLKLNSIPSSSISNPKALVLNGDPKYNLKYSQLLPELFAGMYTHTIRAIIHEPITPYRFKNISLLLVMTWKL